MTETEIDSSSALLEFLWSYPSQLSHSTANAYNKSIRSFIAFAGDDIYITDNAFPDTIPGDWFVDMIMSGLSVKTASYYFDNLCSIIKAAANKGLTRHPEIFRKTKERIRNYRQSENTVNITEEDLKRLQLMIRTADRQTGELAVYTDLAIISLLDPSLNIQKACTLRKDDIDSLSLECKSIAARHLDNRRSYIFPLGQADKTRNQLYRRSNDKILTLLRYRNLPIAHDAQTSLDTLWVYAALRSGLRASTVAATIPDAARNIPLLEIAEAAPADDYSIPHIYDSVSHTLVDNPVCWHVMHLRHGIRYGSLERRFEACKESFTIPATFYPSEAIARKIGRKLVYKDRPLIPGIVFFKTRATNISTIMRHVGDIAWCMRDPSRRDRPYAVISQQAMDTFQQVIGKFTSDTRLYPLGTIQLKPEDRVIIIGGDYSGTEAIVEKVPKETQGDIIYQIRFIDDTGFEWHIPKDQRLLRKLD